MKRLCQIQLPRNPFAEFRTRERPVLELGGQPGIVHLLGPRLLQRLVDVDLPLSP